MRMMIGCVFTSMVLFGAFAHASDTFDTERVKTGILPTGGFYSIYAVDCPDKFTAAIASLRDKRRWCSLNNGEMNCFPKKQEASYSACMSGAVAAANDNLEGTGEYY